MNLTEEIKKYRDVVGDDQKTIEVYVVAWASDYDVTTQVFTDKIKAKERYDELKTGPWIMDFNTEIINVPGK
jgi:hypothetical protein